MKYVLFLVITAAVAAPKVTSALQSMVTYKALTQASINSALGK